MAKPLTASAANLAMAKGGCTRFIALCRSLDALRALSPKDRAAAIRKAERAHS